MVERVYLDTNVYCRPFDNQSDKRIRMESNAFIKIADVALRGKIVIVSSDYVKFEIEKILDPLKRKDVRGFERTLASVNVTSVKRVISLARRFSARCNLNPLDALHVSSACIGKADCFLTCDDEILQKSRCIEELATEEGYKLKVRNPINYLEEKHRVRK
ncbi:MAG: PIN domain-containing protein [Candidatus Bathyarchaeia archaeon]